MVMRGTAKAQAVESNQTIGYVYNIGTPAPKLNKVMIHSLTHSFTNWLTNSVSMRKTTLSNVLSLMLQGYYWRYLVPTVFISDKLYSLEVNTADNIQQINIYRQTGRHSNRQTDRQTLTNIDTVSTDRHWYLNVIQINRYSDIQMFMEIYITPLQ